MSVSLNINTPFKKTYQVRVKRNGKEYSKLFSWNLWGGKKKALQGAINWRDNIRLLYGENSRYRDRPLKNNLSTGVLGVCRSVHMISNRRVNVNHYLVFGVHWIDAEGQRRCKSFRVGNIETITQAEERLAFESACACRADYEEYRRRHKLHKFDISDYFGWRHS